MTDKERMIVQAKKYAKQTGKPMQVVWSDHGGYQVFSVKAGLSFGFREIYNTEGECI